jgi:hypothetical protein
MQRRRNVTRAAILLSEKEFFPAGYIVAAFSAALKRRSLRGAKLFLFKSSRAEARL